MKDRVINRNEIHLAAKWSTTFHIPHCLGYISSSSGRAWTRLLDINSSKWIWLSPEKTNRLSTSPSSLNGILRCSTREEHVFQFQFRITPFPLYRQVITLNKEPICELWENLFLLTMMTMMSCCGFSGSSWFRVSVSLFSVSTPAQLQHSVLPDSQYTWIPTSMLASFQMHWPQTGLRAATVLGSETLPKLAF